MSGKLRSRVFLVVLMVAVAAYLLKNTIVYYSYSPEERAQLLEEGKLADLQSQIIHEGLDLQGGMHVVLEVDLEKLVRSRVEGTDSRIEDLLKRTFAEALATDADFFDLLLKNADAEKIRLARYFPSYEKGPNREVVEALRNDAKDAVDRAEEIIRNRVDQFGVAEPTIQRQGQWRIIVELAGITNRQQARNLIQATALLEFVLLKEDPELLDDVMRRVDKAWLAAIGQDTTALAATADTTGGEDTTAASGLAELLGEGEADSLEVQGTGDVRRPFSSLVSVGQNVIWVPEKNYRKIRAYLKKPEIEAALPVDVRLAWGAKPREIRGDGVQYYPLYLLKKEPELTGSVITDAREAMGGLSGAEFVVHLNMNDEGARKWAKVTAANVNRRVAIVLDGVVQMAPVIKTKIADGRTQIEGLNDIQEAKEMAVVLRAGALPAPMKIIEERTVGASLGADSVRNGTRAALLGFVIVILFMAVYYRLSGLIADLALFLNLLFTLAVLASLNATMTVPGIAALILTVGTAVDANVLIFERIREELRAGKTVRKAIDDGYARALTTIVDANVTTILAALVLWQFGTGTVKGFATTLFWGILTSMITAIFITRTIFMLITERRVVTQLSI